jgi:hypothetical protein
MSSDVSGTGVAISNLSNTQTLFVLRSADMTLTSDQAFTKLGGFTKYVVTNIIAVAKTGAFGTACVGGIYSAASKGGDPILAAAQVFSNLTGVGLAMIAVAANIIQKQETATPFLSLTTGNTGALTADFFIVGVIVD